MLSVIKSWLKIFILVVITIVATGCQSYNYKQDDITPQEPNNPISADRLNRGLVQLAPDDIPLPVLPANPSQADYGEDPYYQICMACHGNWGEGLTDEWRALGFGEDQDCWRSKCHHTNHPPEGFDLPHVVPPVTGHGSLARISTAEDLHTVISDTMPWWNPGSLTPDQAWALTAFLMRARGEITDDTVLTSGTAPIYRLHVLAAKHVDEEPFVITLILALFAALTAYFWRKKV